MADNDRVVESKVASVPRQRRAEPVTPGPDYRTEATLTVTVGGRHDRTVVTEVVGEIDLRTCETLRARLLELLEEDVHNVVVDFDQVRFCDASGLGTLVAVHNRLRRRGGELRVARAHPAQRRLFRITALDRVITLYTSVDDALRGLGAEGAGKQATLN